MSAPEEMYAIHVWFNLTYAQYLTLPRTLLQSMPDEWQNRFVKCLRELENAFGSVPQQGCYWVKLRDDQGHFITDPLADYERGRRRIPLKTTPEGQQVVRGNENETIYWQRRVKRE